MPHRFKGERTPMRIFIGESDKYQGKPLYEALLERLRAKGLEGWARHCAVLKHTPDFRKQFLRSRAFRALAQDDSTEWLR